MAPGQVPVTAKAAAGTAKAPPLPDVSARAGALDPGPFSLLPLGLPGPLEGGEPNVIMR